MFVLDWGDAAFSSYLELTYCYIPTMGEWIGQVAYDCASNGYTGEIEDVAFVGHCLGAHKVGFAGQYLKNENEVQVEQITGLDPAGPFYANGRNVNVQCQGLKIGTADIIDAWYTNPRGFGTDYFVLGDFNYHVNGNVNYCQYGTACDPVACHLYASEPLFTYLARNENLDAVSFGTVQPTQAQLNTVDSPLEPVQWYDLQDEGHYNLRSADNPVMRNE